MLSAMHCRQAKCCLKHTYGPHSRLDKVRHGRKLFIADVGEECYAAGYFGNFLLVQMVTLPGHTGLRSSVSSELMHTLHLTNDCCTTCMHLWTYPFELLPEVFSILKKLGLLAVVLVLNLLHLLLQLLLVNCK